VAGWEGRVDRRLRDVEALRDEGHGVDEVAAILGVEARLVAALFRAMSGESLLLGRPGGRLEAEFRADPED
jgi:hypothetical protein